MSRALAFVFLFIAFGSSAAKAAGLDAIHFKPGLRIGVYHGTFDPPHLGHENVAREAVRAGSLDYLLFVPNDQAFHKPGATDFETRWRMSSERFSDSDRIIVPEVLGSESPMLNLALEWIRERAPDAKLVGVVGSDNVIGNHRGSIFNTQLDSFMNEWLVNARDGFPRDSLPKSIAGKRATTFDADDHGLSSTALRKSIRSGEAAVAVHDRVLEFIRKHNLYDVRGLKCSSLFAN